jgi:anti-sigma regulatory factor (Ser/Thr protein kinase)
MPNFEIEDQVDILRAQSGVRRFADQLGFDNLESQELAIVASELASNILKYGDHGQVLAQALMAEKGPCLELVAIDYGPPFDDLEAAKQDGWDQSGPIDPGVLLKRKGFGGGLGAIVRLTDSFKVEQRTEGKQIITRRYLRKKPLRTQRRPRL